MSSPLYGSGFLFINAPTSTLIVATISGRAPVRKMSETGHFGGLALSRDLKKLSEKDLKTIETIMRSFKDSKMK